MGTDPGDPAEVSSATAAPPDGARKTWSPHLELASRARALWRDLSWREASGSLGDLGTFLPLLVGLTVESGLDVAPVISHRLRYDEFREGFEAMRSGNAGKVILNWEDI